MRSSSKQLKVSIELIKSAIEEKFVKPLAVFYKLKACFSNSCIYDYRTRMRELAIYCGISTRTLYSYLKILNQKELVSSHQNNLILESTSKMRLALGEKRIWKIKIYAGDNVREVEAKIYGKIIEQHAYMIAIAEAMARFESRDKRKTAQKFDISENEFRPSISLRNLAKLLRLSHQKVAQVIEILNECRIIITENQKPQKRMVAGTTKHFEGTPGHKFISHGNLYVQYGMRFQFLDFPMRLPNLDYRRYVKIRNASACKKFNNPIRLIR